MTETKEACDTILKTLADRTAELGEQISTDEKHRDDLTAHFASRTATLDARTLERNTEFVTIKGKWADPGVEIREDSTQIQIQHGGQCYEYDEDEMPTPTTIGVIKHVVARVEGIAVEVQSLQHAKGRHPLGDEERIVAGTVLKLTTSGITIHVGKEKHEYAGEHRAEGRAVIQWLAVQLGCLVDDLKLRRGRALLKDDDLLVAGEAIKATRKCG